jgi:hypothetical protein
MEGKPVWRGNHSRVKPSNERRPLKEEGAGKY